MTAPGIRLVASAVLLLALGACSARAGGTDEPAPAPRDGQASADAQVDTTDDATAAAREAEAARLEALYRARADSALAQYTEADVHFMAGMIAHHAQAIVMSRLVPERSASPQVELMARRIINSQEGEIRRMQQWLRARGEVVPEFSIDGLELTIRPASHDMHMPGMLSDARLRELAAAEGPAFDPLFLRSMIEHHEGALHMVDELFAADGAGQDPSVFELAAAIHADQLMEIARMRAMLERLEPAEETGAASIR